MGLSQDDHNRLIETTTEKRWKIKCIRGKKFGNLTTDRLILVQLLISNEPISQREELYPPVWYILKTAEGWADEVELWSTKRKSKKTKEA